jgi:hypothetical protein
MFTARFGIFQCFIRKVRANSPLCFVAEFVSPEKVIDEKPQRRILGPRLPGS